jgi:uncharacterized RDD family membrane protein YckC
MTQYADLGKRFLAALLDLVIVIIISFLIRIVVGIVLSVINNDTLVSLVGNLVGIAIGWLYYTIQEISPKQATLGKQALGIVVTDLNGKRISFVKATIRYFSRIISAIILFIGYIMAAFTEKKQALHDIIAGTLVVNKR